MAGRERAQDESWHNIHRSPNSDDLSPEDMSSPGSAHTNPRTLDEIHRMLRPLQATADEIGKQVEDFAQSLDRLTGRRTHEQSGLKKDCQHILPFAHAYRTIASDTVEHLQRLQGSSRRSALSKHGSSKDDRKPRLASKSNAQSKNTTAASNARDTDDLEHWIEEEKTWDLLETMMHLKHPIQDNHFLAESDQNFARPQRSTSISKFCSLKEAWGAFLASDDLAWERRTVLQWLERTAERSGPSIDQVIEDAENDSNRGSGLVAHSWLYTREAIKGHKRLRSWPRALEPEDPGLETSLTNVQKTQALVTQLDPDAMTRQVRTLEVQDLHYERAMWTACWEMVRRGKSWDFISNWCEERGEHWRATAIRPALHLCQSRSSEREDWKSHGVWRRVCAIAARDGGVDAYERAVNGTLGGYLSSTQVACKTWADHIFVHYKAFLDDSFDKFASSSIESSDTLEDKEEGRLLQASMLPNQRALSGSQLIEKLKLSEATRKEASDPFKLLQGSLIAGTFHDFVYKQGVRLCQQANLGAKSKLLPVIDDPAIDKDMASIDLGDFNLLRIVTHIIFIYQEMDHDFGEGDRRSAMESFIVAYVDFLSKAGKQQLLPLYAARLSHERSVICLARQLPLVRETKERENLMRLMNRTGIDVHGVLKAQLRLIIEDTPPDEAYQTRFPELRILTPTKANAVRMPSIEAGFNSCEITEDHMDLVCGLEWYKILKGYWHHTMALGVMIYKHFLRCHAISAASLLSEKVPFSDISICKTPAILGDAIDLSQYHPDPKLDKFLADSKQTFPNDALLSSQGLEDTSWRPSEVNSQEILLRQSRSFRDLENLFVAIRAIESWASMADRLQQLSRYVFPRLAADQVMLIGIVQANYRGKVPSDARPIQGGLPSG